MNGIYPAVEARRRKVKNVFQFRDMPRSNLPLVGHSSALSRLTGSSPVAALASSHLFTTLLRQLYNDRRQTEYTAYTLSTRRREAHRVCRRQGHPRTETAYPPPRRRVRHDRQQLHAGKGFQLQTESEVDSKAGGRHGNPYRLPERPFELHLRPPWHGPGKTQADVRQLPVHARVAQGTGQARQAHHGRA